jgi:hypothetical protein
LSTLPDDTRDTLPVSAPSSSLTFAAGQIVGDRFRIVRFIASGGMGELYEAEDHELHEHVALKTVRPDIAQDATVIARFKREAFLARRVTHPNICRIFDLFRHQLVLAELTAQSDRASADMRFAALEKEARERGFGGVAARAAAGTRPATRASKR